MMNSVIHQPNPQSISTFALVLLLSLNLVVVLDCGAHIPLVRNQIKQITATGNSVFTYDAQVLRTFLAS